MTGVGILDGLKIIFSQPLLSVLQQLDELVQQSDPKNWPETLAILSTYGKSDEFPNLCIALGDLLESSGDTQSASLCYMCSLSLERAVRFWRGQLEEANMVRCFRYFRIHLLTFFGHIDLIFLL
jgi:hypothetical protein